MISPKLCLNAYFKLAFFQISLTWSLTWSEKNQIHDNKVRFSKSRKFLKREKKQVSPRLDYQALYDQALPLPLGLMGVTSWLKTLN